MYLQMQLDLTYKYSFIFRLYFAISLLIVRFGLRYPTITLWKGILEYFKSSMDESSQTGGKLFVQDVHSLR